MQIAFDGQGPPGRLFYFGAQQISDLVFVHGNQDRGAANTDGNNGHNQNNEYAYPFFHGAAPISRAAAAGN